MTVALRKVHELGLEVSPGQRCPYCHGDVEARQRLVACPGCRTVLHAPCAADGRCTTLGCALGPQVARKAVRFKPRAARSRRPWRRRLAAARPRWRRLAGCAALFAIGFWACYQGPVEVDPGHLYVDPYPVPYVEPPAPPPAPTPIVSDLRAPARVDRDVVFVSGTVPLEAGAADVVIRSPSGEVTLAAQPPGPFLGAVSLPRPGLHPVTVEITDARGRRQQVTWTVERVTYPGR